MTETHETTADVIAEMRGIRVREFQDYADRLEAAIKRERAKIEADALEVGGIVEAEHRRECGDMAKLREFARLVSHMNDDGYWNGSASVCALVGKAKAALAAPPRNCDKYATYNDAMQAFDAFVREQGKLGFINLYTESFKWLLATATEKKGVKDGNE